jgi:hypothetical protein
MSDKRSLPKKKINCPSITHTENDLWQDLTRRTKEKYVSIQIQHNAPSIPTKAFFENYDLIFGRKKFNNIEENETK